MALNYEPDRDIPDLLGKSIFITGGTGGLGAASALELAKHNPAHIYISGRNRKSAENVIEQVKTQSPKSNVEVTFIECDLSSLISVREAADRFISSTPTPRLDVLMCNAGVMNRPPEVTADGYEVQFATNHLGHALLIRKFIPLLEKTQKDGGDGRIVILSSTAWRMHPGGIMFDTLRTTQNMRFMGPWKRYAQSKLSNMLYARELSKRYPHLTSVSVHPGYVSTGLFTEQSLKDRIMVQLMLGLMLIEPHEGTYNQLWATTKPKEELVNGAFYMPVGENGDAGLDKTCKDKDGILAKRLWEYTEEALEGY